MMNIYRLATEVNAMRRAEDYTEMAQLSIESGVPGEAQSALETAFSTQGVHRSSATIDRNNRLLTTAKGRLATDKPRWRRRTRGRGRGQDRRCACAVARPT